MSFCTRPVACELLPKFRWLTTPLSSTFSRSYSVGRFKGRRVCTSLQPLSATALHSFSRHRSFSSFPHSDFKDRAHRFHKQNVWDRKSLILATLAGCAFGTLLMAPSKNSSEELKEIQKQMRIVELKLKIESMHKSFLSKRLSADFEVPQNFQNIICISLRIDDTHPDFIELQLIIQLAYFQAILNFSKGKASPITDPERLKYAHKLFKEKSWNQLGLEGKLLETPIEILSLLPSPLREKFENMENFKIFKNTEFILLGCDNPHTGSTEVTWVEQIKENK